MTDPQLTELLRVAVPEPAPATDRAARARVRAARIRRNRRAWSAAGVVAVVAAALVGGHLAAGSRGGHTASPIATPPSPSVAWHPCTGAACPAQVLAAVRHPLRLPAMPADGHCPVSRVHDLGRLDGFSGRVHGITGGPLSLTTSAGATPSLAVSPAGHGWMEQKVIWGFPDDYAGPVLVRGGRIDAPGPMGFHRYIGAAGYDGGAGDGPHHRLLYLRGGLGVSAPANGATTSEPSGIYVRSPGCYAVQADGEGISGTFVFRVVGN